MVRQNARFLFSFYGRIRSPDHAPLCKVQRGASQQRIQSRAGAIFTIEVCEITDFYLISTLFFLHYVCTLGGWGVSI